MQFFYFVLHFHLFIAIVTRTFAVQKHFQGVTERKLTHHIKSLDLEETPIAQGNAEFTRRLNQVKSMAELASVLATQDKSFCRAETLRNIEKVNSMPSKKENSNSKNDEAMNKLLEQCRNMKLWRSVSLGSESDMTVSDITKMDLARQEVRKGNCKPRTTCVNLELPTDGYLYHPECLMVKRCVGCCNSQLLECQPMEKSNTTRYVMKYTIFAPFKTTAASLTVEQHDKCNCSCKMLPKHCSKFQQYNENSCQCFCPNERKSLECGDKKKWDSKLCQCLCRATRCSTGFLQDKSSCRCERVHKRKRRAARKLLKSQKNK